MVVFNIAGVIVVMKNKQLFLGNTPQEKAHCIA